MHCIKRDRSCDDKTVTQVMENKFNKRDSIFMQKSPELVKIPGKLPESISYIVQLIFFGIRPDSIFEVKMILAPGVDMSSVKITVKDNNLRVRVRKELDSNFKQLLQIINTKLLDQLIDKSVKHCENFLIPETINDEKVRAIIDIKQRMLIITAPCKKIMENLPQHCQANGFFFKHFDYANFEMKFDGVKSGLKFIKVPDFYNIDGKDYFAAEIKVEGLKVSTAALATENVLNIKMQEIEGRKCVRNFNFCIPQDADPRKVSVEFFNGDTIFIRAPLQKFIRERLNTNKAE